MITCTFEDGNSALLRHVVVDALVLKDGKILLVKRTGKLLDGGKWALAGGYVEHGETLAQAVERQIFEETGWKITGLTLLTINDQPDRPNEDRQNVAVVCFCAATEQTGQPDWESDDQRWFDFFLLPADELMVFDHAADIRLYQRFLSENLSLPII